MPWFNENDDNKNVNIIVSDVEHTKTLMFFVEKIFDSDTESDNE